jgi:hypothetical protein
MRLLLVDLSRRKNCVPFLGARGRPFIESQPAAHGANSALRAATLGFAEPEELMDDLAQALK